MSRIPGTTFHDDDTPRQPEEWKHRAKVMEELAERALAVVEWYREHEDEGEVASAFLANPDDDAPLFVRFRADAAIVAAAIEEQRSYEAHWAAYRAAIGSEDPAILARMADTVQDTWKAKQALRDAVNARNALNQGGS